MRNGLYGRKGVMQIKGCGKRSVELTFYRLPGVQPPRGLLLLLVVNTRRVAGVAFCCYEISPRKRKQVKALP
jgi:hypothetical protein